MTSNTVIKVENLSKVYKLYNSPVDRLKESLHPLRRNYHHDYYAIKNINFEIKKGESVGIIGKNGSGKSTLLKILTGVLTPSSGSVEINGKISALLELGAGFNPELNGMENVYFNGMLMGYNREEMDKRLDNILSFADIGEFVNQPVKTYSSGMFVRLAFAVAVNVEPEILIIDEALAVGDLRFQKKCKEKMNEFRSRGITIVLVSHTMSDIVTGCKIAIFLKQGEMISFGNAQDVVGQYLEEDARTEALKGNISNLSSDYSGNQGGTGDIVITGLRCFQQGKSINNNNIEFGKSIIIEANYDALVIIEKPIFRFNLSVTGYRFFANFDINYEQHGLDYISGKGVIRVVIESPNLYPNAYSANISVLKESVNSHLFYWIDACNFVITALNGTTMYNPSSIIELKHRVL